MLAASTEMPLSDMAGLYELRDELRSDNGGRVLVMLLMVSVVAEMEEASEVILLGNSGGMPGMELNKSALVTAGMTDRGGPIRPGGKQRLSATKLSVIS